MRAAGWRLARRVSSLQTTSVFAKFLREASTFYALLTLKLQAAYGQLGFALDFPGLDDLAAATERTVIPAFKTSLDCRISIYRCLICLGDLARWGVASRSPTTSCDYTHTFMFGILLWYRCDQLGRQISYLRSCRYEEMAVKDAASKKDWSRAEQYYYQAVDVFPEGTIHTVTRSKLSLSKRQLQTSFSKSCRLYSSAILKRV